MKYSLIGLLLLGICLKSYSQLNLDFESNGIILQDSTESIVDLIIKNNPHIGSYRSYDTFEFDDGIKFNFTVYKDKRGRFLDLIFFKKPLGAEWEIFPSKRLYKEQLGKVIVNVQSNNRDWYKFIFNDKSFIDIKFNLLNNRTNSRYRYYLVYQKNERENFKDSATF